MLEDASLDEIVRVTIIALIGLISALATQVFLRLDQARRELKKALLEDIKHEQKICEGIAYRARNCIVAHGKTKKLAEDVQLDDLLFQDVYNNSKLVTLCAELETVGISSEKYHAASHQFRNNCEKAVKEFLELGTPTQELIENSVGRIKNASLEVSASTREIMKRVSDRFRYF